MAAMSFTRRTFLKLLSLALALPYPGRLFAASMGHDTAAILTAFLDTLMPADETPAASELGVDKTLLDKAETDRRYRRLLTRGCDWLDNMAVNTYQTHFTALTEQQRIHVVKLMERSEPGTLARVFFSRLRTDLFEHYYSQPASWKGLDIDRPPQPNGYPDYNRPPATRS